MKILNRTELYPNKVAMVMGTRPGIIKMSPLYFALLDLGIETVVVHSGQHYSPELDSEILEACGNPSIKTYISLNGAKTHAEQTAVMMTGIEKFLFEERPSLMIVCGDANTNFAAAVAARKLRIAVAHVEAGLRSNDWLMPEEHNRVMIDHISDLLFAPTENSKTNLINESVKGQVHVVGNTIVDATLRAKNINNTKEFHDREKFILFTTHREEIVDTKEKLDSVIDFLSHVQRNSNLEIAAPLHPRTIDRLKRFGLVEKFEKVAKIEKPAPYLEFNNLLSTAEFVITDSGGVQEEACILGTPVYTIRENTERPETVECGANSIIGTSYERFSQARESQIPHWTNPYGDGRSSQKISELVRDYLENI